MLYPGSRPQRYVLAVNCRCHGILRQLQEKIVKFPTALCAHPPMFRSFSISANGMPLAFGWSAPEQHGVAT
jgi:hypothetical protein